MQRLLLGLILLLVSSKASAISSADYLPSDADLDPSIPTPESVLGWDVGEWHVRHDQLVLYMKTLAAASPRISIKVIGHTHEQRELLQLAITDPGRHDDLETVRAQHLESQGQGPLVLWMGYSIHGNEASGSNASMLVAYYLAASRSEFVSSLLAESVILLDPSFNPDGLGRFASWVNSHRSKTLVSDPNNREHQEAWPQGRTNHYWYDLNRDWLLLQHPESRARIAEYHRWRPHVLTDFHEQGGNREYFFQPGAPTRKFPLTPDTNVRLTEALAMDHGRALDADGQLYFTQERFDDFYIGKGSTYPDITGAIGILFEQGSARGHLMDTDNGLLPFTRGIKNHFTTSLSTFRGALRLRDELLGYRQNFNREMERRRSQNRNAGWIVGDDGDPARAQAMLSVLAQHQIEAQPLTETVTVNGQRYLPGQAWFLSNDQEHYGLLQAVMEQRTSFEDATFYDVSAWTLPLAYNLPFAEVRTAPATGTPPIAGQPAIDQDTPVGWAIAWGNHATPALLQKLLANEIPVKASSIPLTLPVGRDNVALPPGALIIPSPKLSAAQRANVVTWLAEARDNHGIVTHNITSGLAREGADVGSSYVYTLEPVKPLLLVGNGVNGYEAGELWHWLDETIGLPPVMVQSWQLEGLRFSDYTHLFMVDGDYSRLSDTARIKVDRWISDGGVLVASRGAAKWVESGIAPPDPDAEAEDGLIEPAEDEAPGEGDQEAVDRPYASFDNDAAARIIGGAIVQSTVDRTHPLGFGLRRNDLPLLKSGSMNLTPSDNAYATVARLTDAPVLAGFVGEERLEEISGQPTLIAERQGRGLIVRSATNLTFRGYWKGGQRILANALFLGQIVQPTVIE